MIINIFRWSFKIYVLYFCFLSYLSCNIQLQLLESNTEVFIDELVNEFMNLSDTIELSEYAGSIQKVTFTFEINVTPTESINYSCSTLDTRILFTPSSGYIEDSTSGVKFSILLTPDLIWQPNDEVEITCLFTSLGRALDYRRVSFNILAIDDDNLTEMARRWVSQLSSYYLVEGFDSVIYFSAFEQPDYNFSINLILSNTNSYSITDILPFNYLRSSSTNLAVFNLFSIEDTNSINETVDFNFFLSSDRYEFIDRNNSLILSFSDVEIMDNEEDVLLRIPSVNEIELDISGRLRLTVLYGISSLTLTDSISIQWQITNGESFFVTSSGNIELTRDISSVMINIMANENALGNVSDEDRQFILDFTVDTIDLRYRDLTIPSMQINIIDFETPSGE